MKRIASVQDVNVPVFDTGVNRNGESASISFVIPVRDEQATVFEVYDCLVANTPGSYCYELIFVDDGSDDESWAKIVALASLDECVRGLRFGTNAGKAKAIMAGISAASGTIIFTMDAHLPEASCETERFLEKLRDGYDLVSGCHCLPKTTWHRVLRRWSINQALRLVSRVKLRDYRCGLKCFRSVVAKALVLEIVGKSAFGRPADHLKPRVAEIFVGHPARSRARCQTLRASLTDIFSMGRIYRLLQKPSLAIHPVTSTYANSAGLLFVASIIIPADSSSRMGMLSAAVICTLLASLALVGELMGELLVRRGYGPSLRLPVVQDTSNKAVLVGPRERRPIPTRPRFGKSYRRHAFPSR